MRRPSPAVCPPADTGSESPPRQVPWKAPPIHQGLVRFSEVTPQVPAASRPAGQVPLHRGALRLPDNEKVQWRTVAPAPVLLGGSTGEHGVARSVICLCPRRIRSHIHSLNKGGLHTLPQGTAENERRRLPSGLTVHGGQLSS